MTLGVDEDEACKPAFAERKAERRLFDLDLALKKRPLRLCAAEPARLGGSHS